MPPKLKDDCGVCSKQVGAKDGIQCEICDKWLHAKCAGIASEVYEFISNYQQIHWFCQGCNAGVGQHFKDLKRVQEKISNIEHTVDKIREEERKDLEKIKSQIDNQNEKTQKAMDKITHEMHQINLSSQQ